MGSSPMGYTKTQANTVRAPFVNGDIQVTPTMSSASVSNIMFEAPLSQVSMQSTGNLVFTYAPSITNQSWSSASSNVTANTIATYNSSVVMGMQITWVSGSGTVVLAGVA